MKRLLALLLCLTLLCGCTAALPYTSREVIPLDCGIPALQAYPEGIPARNIWDMAVANDRLWLGGGDYDKNSGPVTMYYYDLNSRKWGSAAALPDEEISRFVMLGDTLYATGTDPKEDWEWGNYYRLSADGNTWETQRVLPGGVHNFDLTEFDGKLFAALGVEEGRSPVVCSEDGGKTFREVPLLRDGTPIDTTGGVYIRVHRFFVHDNWLYALYRFADDQALREQAIFRYENGSFTYHADWSSAFTRVRFNHKVISEAVCVGDKTYFTSGKLYATEDFKTVSPCVLQEDAFVTDLVTMDGTLCALAVQKIDSDTTPFRISWWQCKEDGWSERWYFYHELPAVSALYHGGTCYVALGAFTDTPHPKNGTLLAVLYPK